MNSGFIQTTRNQDETLLFSKRPTALLLLLLIAQRAKRTEDHPDKELQVGEAYIGDWETYCSGRQIYRTDVKFLEKHQKLTTRTTNRGTIARIVTTSPFNINEEKVTLKLTNSQPSANHQLTTNKKDKNEKNENIYSEILEHYNTVMRRRTKSIPREAIAKWLEIYNLEEIKEAISNIPSHNFMNNIELATLFRFRNPNHEEVDYIGMYLNQKKSPASGFTPEEYAILHAPMPVMPTENE